MSQVSQPDDVYERVLEAAAQWFDDIDDVEEYVEEYDEEYDDFAIRI